jgi:hypothetical protein
MERDPNSTATYGDLLVLEKELRGEMHAIRGEMHAMERRLTVSLAAEIARSANVVMEHMTSLVRVQGEQLDAHIADATVHKRARRR